MGTKTGTMIKIGHGEETRDLARYLLAIMMEMELHPEVKMSAIGPGINTMYRIAALLGCHGTKMVNLERIQKTSKEGNGYYIEIMTMRRSNGGTKTSV